MTRSELESALDTTNCSIRFLILFVLGLLLSLYSVLLQRRRLCRSLEGGDPDALPSPYPLQHAAGGVTLGGLVYFFFLARRVWQDAREGGNAKTECLARWNLLASTLVLIASVIRLWALEQSQDGGGDSLAREEDEDLPA